MVSEEGEIGALNPLAFPVHLQVWCKPEIV